MADSDIAAITITVDGEAFGISIPTMSGAQLKALAKKDAIYQVFQEATDTKSDHLVADHEAIVVHDGQRFYTIPPALAGLRSQFS